MTLPKDAFGQGQESVRNLSLQRPLTIVGMGGSGIGGALIAMGHPDVHAINGWAPPTRPSGTLLLVSYSGDTVETLSWLPMLQEGDCVISSGGTMTRYAKEERISLIPVLHSGPPRRTLYEVAGILDALLSGGDSVWDGSAPSEELLSATTSLAHSWQEERRFPWVFGHQGEEALAHRWAGMLHEDAKVPAGVGILPEALHNQLEGVAGSPHPMGVIALPRLSHGEATLSNLRRGLGETPCWTPSTTSLFELLQLGDAFALAWAEGRGVDPHPVPAITAAKG